VLSLRQPELETPGAESCLCPNELSFGVGVDEPREEAIEDRCVERHRDDQVCTDRVVSYGFPRAASDPKYTRYILQYEGTKKRGNVLVNDANGDIATIYTEPNDDWGKCATWVP